MNHASCLFRQDGSGNNGLYYAVELTCKLLDPKCSENSALYVGKFVNTLVTKVMLFVYFFTI